MDLRIERDDEWTIAFATGAMDDDANFELTERLHPIIEERGTRVLLEISEVPRITSNGIGALVALVARATAHNSRVVLVSPSTFVKSVLKVTRLDTYLTVVPSLEDARNMMLVEQK